MSALDHFARRAAGDPLFLAHAILCYQLATGIDDAGLIAWLGCTSDTLTRLRLCGMPRGPADVAAIAERYGIEVESLAKVVG